MEYIYYKILLIIYKKETPDFIYFTKNIYYRISRYIIAQNTLYFPICDNDCENVRQ